MEKEGYRQHFDLEESFWWFLGRRRALQTFLRPTVNGKEKSEAKRLSILDAGCGTGGMFQLFEAFGEVWGLDLSSEALHYCQRRNLTGRLIQGSALHLPFPEKQFDIVSACDLLSHGGIKDDLEALKELHRVCKRNGHLLLTDSAFECLKSSHDRFLYGVRRYTARSLKRKIEESGFSIKRISYMNMTLFPLIYIWRRLRRNSTGSDLKPIPSPLNRCLTWLFSSEAPLLKQWNLPFGTSLICLAKKP
ncbi:MAG: methyltransferase domain-containing protein [Candidatus Omnitrophica bacterium]|nr:methyltransferase domain-containing protein [Candidatus Omnitrophota bacterium]